MTRVSRGHIFDLAEGDVHIDGPLPAARAMKKKGAAMAEITEKQRKALPNSAFGWPEQRRYPIQDKAHADNALARLEREKASMPQATYAQVKARIRAAQKRFGETPKKARALKRRLHIRADLAEGGSLHVRHMSDGTEVVYLPSMDISGAI